MVTLQPIPYPARVIQIIIVYGFIILALGIAWIILTLPVSTLLSLGLSNNWFDSDMMPTVNFFSVFLGAIPIIIGLALIASGWVRTVEQREYGL